MRRDGPLAPADAVGWTIRLAKRIEELHRLGVAHGGLSATSVQTEAAERSSRGVLADVRSSSEAVAFQSPERLEGRGISQADDTWAITVVLYFLLTGALPFPGDRPADVRARMDAGPPRPLAELGVQDPSLQQVIDQFLVLAEPQRSSRAASLRDTLERWGGAPDLAGLFPLEEEDTDDFGSTFEDDDDDEDDEEDIATVMRDFSDVRAELDRHYQGGAGAAAAPPRPGPEQLPPAPPPMSAQAPAPAAGRPPAPRPAAGAPPSAPVAPPVAPAGLAPADEPEDDQATVVMMGEEADEVAAAVKAAMEEEGLSAPGVPAAKPRPAAGAPAPRPAAGQPPLPPPGAGPAAVPPAFSGEQTVGLPAGPEASGGPATELLNVGSLLGPQDARPAGPPPAAGAPPPIPQFAEMDAPPPSYGVSALAGRGVGQPAPGRLPPAPALPGAGPAPPPGSGGAPFSAAQPPGMPGQAPAGMAAMAGAAVRPSMRPHPASPSMRPPAAMSPPGSPMGAPLVEMEEPRDKLRTWLGVAIIMLMIVLAVVGLLWLRRAGIVEVF